MIINGIEVKLTGNISTDELTIYLTQLQAKSKGKIISAEVTVDGEFVGIKYETKFVPFYRIKRITGYLTGSTDKWNNAKRAELKDRVKHG